MQQNTSSSPQINGSNNSKISQSRQALPFVIYENGKFLIPNETKQYLSNETYKNIGIISLVGKYRTGKSFLLNRVIWNQIKSSGFNVGPTIKPCTKGIWLWSDPWIISNSFCKDPFPCFLIDTEGLEAYDEEINHDSKIFWIAIWISSLFIFNSFGTWDENSINSLSFILNLTKTIKLRSSSFDMDSQENPSELAEYFPNLLWLLRDFSLKLENKEGHDITEKEFLEFAWQNIKGEGEAIDDKNTIRRLIRSYFPERDWFVMVRPVEKESDWQKLQTLPNEKLRKEFLDQAEEFRDKVIKSTKPKWFHNKNWTGTMLVEWVQSVLNAINEGNIPIIENTWKYVVQSECIKNTNNYLVEFKSEIEKYRQENSNNPDFAKKIKELTQKLSNLYVQKMKQNGWDEEFSKEYTKKLKEKWDIEIDHFDKENEIIFESNFIKDLEGRVARFSTLIENNSEKYNKAYYMFFSDWEKFKSDIEEASPEFRNRKDIWYESIIQIIKKFIEHYFIKTKQTAEQQINLYKSAIDKLQVRLKEVNEDWINMKKENTDWMSNNNNEKNSYKLKLKSSEDKITKLQNEKTHEKDNYERIIAQLKSDFEGKIQEWNNKTIKLDTDLNVKDEQMWVMKLKNEKTTALNEKKFAIWEKEVQIWKEKYNALVSSIKSNENVTNVELDLLKAQNKSWISEKESIENTHINLDKNMNNIKTYIKEQMKLQTDTNKSLLDKIWTIVNTKEEDNNREKELAGEITEAKLKTEELKNEIKAYESQITQLKKDGQELEWYKELILSFNVLKCLYCSNLIPSRMFKDHFFKCKNSNSSNNGINQTSLEIQRPIQDATTFLSPNKLIISVSEGTVKQDLQGKAYWEYVIKLKYRNHNWKVYKRFNHFANWCKAWTTILRGIVRMPQSSTVFQCVNDINWNNSFHDNKIKQLQQFLIDIAWIEEINKSKLFRQFLNIDTNINVNEDWIFSNEDPEADNCLRESVETPSKPKGKRNQMILSSQNWNEMKEETITNNMLLNANDDYEWNKTVINYYNRENIKNFNNDTIQSNRYVKK